MSYILSALRKADQDSKRREDPAGEHFDEAAWQAPTHELSTPVVSKWVIAVVGILIAIVVLLVWLLLSVNRPLSQRAEPSESSVAEARSPEARVEPAIVTNPEIRSDREAPTVTYSEHQTAAPVRAQAEPVSAAPTRITPIGTPPRSDGPVKLPEISGHLYFVKEPGRSRLFGSGRTYRLGHEFENGLRLTSITKSLAVFEKNGQRYELILNQ